MSNDTFKMEDLVNKVIEKNPKKLAKWKDREIKGAKILSNHRYSKKDDIIQGVDYVLKGGVTISFRDTEDSFIYIKGGYDKGQKSLQEVNDAIAALGTNPKAETVVALNMLKEALEQYVEKLRIRREKMDEKRRNSPQVKKTEDGRVDLLATLKDEDKAMVDKITARNTQYTIVPDRGVDAINSAHRRTMNQKSKDEAELNRANTDEYYIPEDGVASVEDAKKLLKGAVELGDARAKAYENMLDDRKDQEKRAAYAEQKRRELSLEKRKIINELESIKLETEELTIRYGDDKEKLPANIKSQMLKLNNRFVSATKYLDENITPAIALCESIYADAQAKIERVDVLSEKDRLAYNEYAVANHMPPFGKLEDKAQDGKPEGGTKQPTAEKKDEPAEEKKDEAPAEEKKDEAPAEEKKDEAPAEEKKDEAPAEEKKDETPAEEKKDEAPVEEKEDETPVEEKEDETPVEEIEDETPVEEKEDDEEELEDDGEELEDDEEELEEDDIGEELEDDEEELEEDDIGERKDNLPYVQDGEALYNGTRSFSDRYLLRQLAFKVDHNIDLDRDLSLPEKIMARVRFLHYGRLAKQYMTEGKINYVEQFAVSKREKEDLIADLRDEGSITAKKEPKKKSSLSRYTVRETPRATGGTGHDEPEETEEERF